MSNDLQNNTTSDSPVPTTASKKKSGKVAITILVFLWGFWMAWSGWKSSPKPEAKSSAQWKDTSIAPRVAELRQKLAAIEARPVNTADDYITNAMETQPIVDEGKGLTEKQMAMIVRFKQAYPNDTGDALAADYMMRLTEKDAQLLSLFTDEIECAKRLKGLPAPARVAFYNEKVLPIKDKEGQVAKESFAIAKDAKANGVPLPAYVDQSLAQH